MSRSRRHGERPTPHRHAAGQGAIDGFVVLTALYLCVALTCGGSSASPMSALIVRVCAVPVLAMGVWRLSLRGPGRLATWLLWLAAAATGVILLQLIPLPPEVWRRLPGHESAAQAFATAHLSPPWLPINLTPRAGWGAFLGLIPPAAMLCAVLTIGNEGRRALAAVVLAVAAASLILGVLQLAGGAESPLRFYAVTNPGSAVGFFANRNHQAAFLAVTLPLAAYLGTRWAARGGARGLFWGAAAIGYSLAVAIGAAVTGSRAGVLLILLGGAGAVMTAMRTRAASPGKGWRLASLSAPAAVLLLGAGVTAIAVDGPLRAVVETRAGSDLRFSLNPRVAAAGAAFAPFGSGAGSFATVYAMFEPVDELGPAFVNHAHDDFVETWLEAGWAGVALIAAFLAWWVVASLAAVADRRQRGAALALAASMVVGMLLIASMVDYPLRTPALAALVALACGLIVRPGYRGPIAAASAGRS